MKRNTYKKRTIIHGLSMAVFVGACLGLQADDKGVSAQGQVGSSGAAVDVRTDRSDRDTRVDYRNDRDNGKLSRGDANFIREASKGGLMEVKMGQSAKDRSANAEVKSYGERLVKDHTDANAKLTQLAMQKGLDLAKETDKGAVHDHGKMVMDLEKKTGADFDRAFIKYAIKDHKKDIDKFEKASRDSEDTDVRSFASSTLPKLREHQMEAERLARSLGIDVNVSEVNDLDRRAEASGAPGLAVENRNSSVNRVDSTVDANRGNGKIDIDVDRDRDAKIQTDVKIDNDKNDGKTLGVDLDRNQSRDANAESKVEVKTDKGDGKTLGVDTKAGDDKTLGIETRKGDNKVLGIETKPGDGKTLGLNTSKTDGKLLGIFPAPGRNKAENKVDVDIDRNDQRVDVDVGAPASSEKGVSAHVDTDKDAKVMVYNDLPSKVQTTITNEGGSANTKVKKHTVNGKIAYKVEIEKNGRNRVLEVAEDGTIIKDNKAK